MLPLTPRPVPPGLRLAAAVARAPAGGPLGVWLRGARTWRGIVVSKSPPHPYPQPVLVDRDLGRLLKCCPAVLVSLGAGVAVVPAEQLIRVRALQVVAGLPYMPTYTQSVQALCALFPDLRGSAAGLEIPLRQRSAEEVLAACAAAGTPILRSRVVYGPLGAGGESARGG